MEDRDRSVLVRPHNGYPCVVVAYIHNETLLSPLLLDNQPEIYSSSCWIAVTAVCVYVVCVRGQV